MINPKKSENRLNTVLNAWETLRPTKTFGGFTLEQFKTKLEPSFEARASIVTLDNQLLAAQNQREEADKESLAAVMLVVNSVKGDPTEGEDGELYEAMGFVRKSERKSGLRRGKKPAAVPA